MTFIIILVDYMYYEYIYKHQENFMIIYVTINLAYKCYLLRDKIYR